KDALLAMEGTINDLAIVAISFDFGFMGGSMGSVVVKNLCVRHMLSLEKKVPLICFSASGGRVCKKLPPLAYANGQNKHSLIELSQAGIPFISVINRSNYGRGISKFSYAWRY
ncbi:MAG: carboxyl transferase domain-containing protein, partial [Gammaproteobacteria bacterium]|nr:carboxyl transferase domain-containing protein [Gammaproteobacteria bacterium]